MKTDWATLNKGRVREGYYASQDSDGFNGAFFLFVEKTPVKIVASDGEGWRHVSVSIPGSVHPPKWAVMCAVKELFWGSDEWVMQLHCPSAENINNHPGCLHLWQPTGEGKIPLPPADMVGIKALGEIDSCEKAAIGMAHHLAIIEARRA